MKSKPAPRVGAPLATDALGTWGIPAGALAVATLGAVLAGTELVPAPVGLAVMVLGLLVLLADRGLRGAFAAPGAGLSRAIVAGLGLGWVLLCYLPFHTLLFPGVALHEPIVIRGTSAALPVSLPATGRAAVDLLLEGELPASAGGGAGVPVQYTITIEDAAHAEQVLSGRFEDNLRTTRVGRRGTATVVQTHHAERRLVANAARGDLTVTRVVLEPAAGAGVTLTAYAHHLPPTPVLVLVALALLAGAVWVDIRVVPESDGTITLATAGAIGTAAALLTSNTVHPTLSSLIGSIIFGGPLGVGLGVLVWTIARRTLVHATR